MDSVFLAFATAGSATDTVGPTAVDGAAHTGFAVLVSITLAVKNPFAQPGKDTLTTFAAPFLPITSRYSQIAHRRIPSLSFPQPTFRSIHTKKPVDIQSIT
jgi:hypothetical protein